MKYAGRARVRKHRVRMAIAVCNPSSPFYRSCIEALMTKTMKAIVFATTRADATMYYRAALLRIFHEKMRRKTSKALHRPREDLVF